MDSTDHLERYFFAEMWRALGGGDIDAWQDRLAVTSGTSWRSPFGVTELGVGALAAAGSALAELIRASGSPPPQLSVDRRLVSQWFSNASSRLVAAAPPRARGSEVSGDYETADGRWIRFQANYKLLRQATLRVLECPEDPRSVAQAVRARIAEEVESEVMDGGGAVAVSRSIEEWRGHPQGMAVASEPLIDVELTDRRESNWRPNPRRPLAGLRVLDLTRVLSGPIGTRFVAACGAEVLRIDGPLADPRDTSGGDLMLGKRCVKMDLRTSAGRDKLLRLLEGADVLIHGYRPGALDGLGLDQETRRAARPGLIEVTLDAYGWTGPWKGRRGFDTLVQFSTGIADETSKWALEDPDMRLPLNSMGQMVDASRPRLTPVQTLDHSTGYLIAAAAIRGVTERLSSGRGSYSRLALARTAQLLVGRRPDHTLESFEHLRGPFEEHLFTGPSGLVERLRFPLQIDGIPLYWERPGDPTGTSTPVWITARGSSKE